MSNPFDDYMSQAATQIDAEMNLSENDRARVSSTAQHLAAQRSRILGVYLDEADQQADLRYLAARDEVDGGNRLPYMRNLINQCNQAEQQVWGQQE